MFSDLVVRLKKCDQQPNQPNRPAVFCWFHLFCSNPLTLEALWVVALLLPRALRHQRTAGAAPDRVPTRWCRENPATSFWKGNWWKTLIQYRCKFVVGNCWHLRHIPLRWCLFFRLFQIATSSPHTAIQSFYIWGVSPSRGYHLILFYEWYVLISTPDMDFWIWFLVHKPKLMIPSTKTPKPVDFPCLRWWTWNATQVVNPYFFARFDLMIWSLILGGDHGIKNEHIFRGVC